MHDNIRNMLRQLVECSAAHDVPVFSHVGFVFLLVSVSQPRLPPAVLCCPLLCLGLWDEDVLLSWCHHQGGVWRVRRAVRDAGQCSSCWRWCSFVSRCEICVLPSLLCIFSSHFPLPSPQIPPEGHVFGTWCCLVAAGCTVLLVPGDLAPCAGVRWQRLEKQRSGRLGVVLAASSWLQSPAVREGVKRGREMAALPSVLWPEAMPGVCVWAKSSKKWQC